MAPHRYPGASARAKDAVYLGHRAGRGAPDPPETGDHVERRRLPRQGEHIADPDIAVRVTVPGHRHQPGRGVDAGAGSAAQAGQLDGEPGPARHVEQPVPGIHTQAMMHGHIFPAVARLAESREVRRLAAPALIRHFPLGRTCARPRHCRSFAPPDRRTSQGPSLRSAILPRQAWGSAMHLAWPRQERVWRPETGATGPAHRLVGPSSATGEWRSGVRRPGAQSHQACHHRREIEVIDIVNALHDCGWPGAHPAERAEDRPRYRADGVGVASG